MPITQPQGYLLSTISVTGPSFTSSTCIIAPKRPEAVRTPRARTALRNSSYSGTAISGGAASETWSPTLLAITVQRELTDHKGFPARIGQAAVHFAGFV